MKLNIKYLVFGLVLIFASSLAVQYFAIPLPEEKNLSNVTVSIDFGDNLVAESVEAYSAFDALNRTHVVEYNNYANGYFITGIDGVSQSATHSWAYFVNGVLPLVSVDSYAVKEGDDVTFVFMENERFYEYFS